jgi:hypothetical protein
MRPLARRGGEKNVLIKPQLMLNRIFRRGGNEASKNG